MNSYINQRGIAETIIVDEKGRNNNFTKWNAAYNGEKANIMIDNKNNDVSSKIYMELDNNDIAELLSIPHINQPLEQRLKQDWKSKKKCNPKLIGFNEKKFVPIKLDNKILTHISSPLYNEHFIIPNSKTRSSNRKKRTNSKKYKSNILIKKKYKSDLSKKKRDYYKKNTSRSKKTI